MDVAASIEQVAGILVREELQFDTAGDGRSYRLLFGSAAVFVFFDTWREDSVVVTVSSPILQEVDPESAGAAHALNLLNDLNTHHYFLRFVFHDGTLRVDYDLLGDALQATELLNAIYAVAGAADGLDDALLDEVGGKAYDTKMAEWSADEEGE